MHFLALLAFLIFLASPLYIGRRLTRSRPADYEAIDELPMVREKTRISVRMENNYWRYWIRGKNLSNCARIYIVEAQGPCWCKASNSKLNKHGDANSG